MTQNYKIDEIKSVIFAKAKSKEAYVLMAIYRDPDLKESWKDASVKQIIAKVSVIAVGELAKLINNDVEGFINTMFYTKDDESIGTICWNTMLQVVNLGNEGIQEINVQQCIEALNKM